jgi:hypothetical protein
MREKERELHILSRRCTVAKLTLRGKSQYEIAREMNVNQSTVCRDIREIAKEWRRHAVRDLSEARGQELDRIGRLELECWDAWERSKQDRQVTTTGRESGPQGDKDKAEIRKEGQAGDPRFLERIAWCISERCKILGLYSPVRHAHGGDPGAPPIEHTHSLDLTRATAEELRYLRELRLRLARDVTNGEQPRELTVVD